ncbi:MAG: DUF1573 domain-containing protein [Verrucomicrobia bacterium]|nr:DUF1573 domain-containing protein [Verrucomicrobiota bacterium]
MKTTSFSLALVLAQFNHIALDLSAAGLPAALPLSAGSQTATTKVVVPGIQFAETSFNFGKVGAADKPQHDFIFTNIGQSVLEITDVRPGCGCTTAGPWDRKVQPGQIGKIPLTFNPANFSGLVTKGATVICNDPAQSNVYLQLQATVWRPVEIQPQSLYFVPVDGDPTKETKVVRIVSNLKETLRLEAPHSSNPAFQVELKTVRPGQEFELLVTYSGPVSNASPYGNITIQTSSTNQPVLSLTTAGMPQPAFAVMPPVIRLPAGPIGSDFKYAATIRNNGRQALTLSEPAVNAEGVTAQVQELEPGKTFRINVGFARSFQPRPGQRMELAIKTSHPRYPMLKVPITQ